MDRNRHSLREGKAYLDGNLILDCIKLNVVFIPEVVESSAIGQKGKSRRYIGHDVTGTLVQYKSTPWLKEIAKKYIETGVTPKLTIVGISDDPASDYGAEYGKDIITVENAVITSEIPLLQLDREGELTQEEVEFGAENIIIS